MGPFRIHTRPRGPALSPSNGFTLIEMLVVLAIIVVVTAIIVTSHSSFNNSFIVNNTAYDIALSLRNAEIYGIGGHTINAGATPGYGLDFASAPVRSYTFFADTNPPVPANSTPDVHPGDGVYTPGDQLITTYSLGNGMLVSDFCAYGTGVKYCASDGSATAVDIVFVRPNAVANITAVKSGGNVSGLASACITVLSPQGTKRAVAVTALGQVTLPTTCP